MKFFLSVFFFVLLFSAQAQNDEKLLKLYYYWERWSGKSTYIPLDSNEISLNAKYGIEIVEKSSSITTRQSKINTLNLNKLRLLNGNCWQERYRNDVKTLELDICFEFDEFIFTDTNSVKLKLVSRIHKADKYKFNRHDGLSCWSSPTVLKFEVLSVKEGKLIEKYVEVSGYGEFKKFYKHRKNRNRIYKLKIAKRYHCNSVDQTDIYQIID